MSLEGKTALVTGSGRNIGRSIALALARDGADVVVNARSNQSEAEAVAAEVEELGRRALPILADVGDKEQLEGLLDQALDKFGGLDIVVNNAATRPHKPFAEMTYDDWRGVLATDLDSAFLTTKAALPGMMQKGWGRVVNLSGLQAFQGRHGGAHISAAKVGLIGLTRALATELGPSGIVVNCIVPGPSTPAGRDCPTPPGVRPALPRYRWDAWGTRTTSPPCARSSAPTRPGSSTGRRSTATEGSAPSRQVPTSRTLQPVGPSCKTALQDTPSRCSWWPCGWDSISFGGPIAHIGYFREEYVARRKWLDDRAYLDIVALCQFLPGPASSQVGIIVGMTRAGLAGGLAAWLGFTLPSAIILTLFALEWPPGTRRARDGSRG